jgi:two-component system NtrC family sensor kinase
MSVHPAGAKARRILVVDDTTANLHLLTRLLTEHGYLVHPASDAELALDFVRTTVPDLILLDIRMPGMDGFEVCRRLKADERTRSVPIVLVSVLEDEGAKVRGFREGAVDYITKPFQPEEVLARVDTHVRIRDLTERLELKVSERTQELLEANERLQQEIVERRQAEETLRESEERLRRQHSTLRSIIDSAEAPIFSLDRQYRYTSFNQGHAAVMRAHFGADIELGHSLLEYVDVPLDRKTAEANLERALAGETLIEEAYSGAEPHARSYFQVSHSPIRTESGEVIGVTVLAQDITERKRVEDEIRELNRNLERRVRDRTRQLEASTQERDRAFRELQMAHARILHQEKMAAIGQLATGIAHEINTPAQYLSDNLAFLERALPQAVAALSSYRELRASLADGSTEGLADADMAYFIDEVPRALRESRVGVQCIARIISAMRDFAHRGSDQPERADLSRLISNAAEMSRNEWSAVGELDVSIGPGASTLVCLPDRLSQVILNLLVNAAHAIADAGRPPGAGRMKVSTRLDGDWLEILVEDNGCGIPAEDRHRIFEPFFTTKPAGRGTGQGLAIAHDIVVGVHQGHLRVDSEPGAGTTFTIRLPAQGPSRRPPDAQEG